MICLLLKIEYYSFLVCLQRQEKNPVILWTMEKYCLQNILMMIHHFKSNEILMYLRSTLKLAFCVIRCEKNSSFSGSFQIFWLYIGI